MLVELLTGERPFRDGATAADAPLPVRYPQLAEPPRLARELPSGLVRVIETCLQKDARARPQSAVDLARALDPFTAVKVWPVTLPAGFEPFAPPLPLTPLRRLRS